MSRTGTEAELRKRTHELAARVKEINCLYRVSSLLQREDLDDGVKLRQLPGLVLAGLRHPELGRVRIELEGSHYDAEWQDGAAPDVVAPVELGGEVIGRVAVAYANGEGEVPEPSEAEATLIGVIATRLAALVERRRAVAERQILEEQLRQSQKMEAIGRLAGGIAHDFNNLLTSIKGLSALALADIEADSPIRPDLEEIERAANRAAALTRQLLAFSRKQMLRLVPVNVNVVVEGLESMLRRVLLERTELRTSCEPDLPMVMADAGQLEQVVMNLTVNAQDAMPDGGVVEIATERRTLGADTAAGEAPGDYVVLSVTDNGTGIRADEIDKIFEPFFTTKGPGKGTGLGLATVFGIVKQSGGHVRVDSEPGRGSRFEVLLPVAAPDRAAPHAEARETEEEHGGDETILLAEDDESVNQLVVRILERAGYTVLSATRADAAARLASDRNGPIHLLVTDVGLPDQQGDELFATIRRDRPDVRVLYISGYTDNPAVRREVESATGDYLAKPFQPERLLAAVRRVLDREQN